MAAAAAAARAAAVWQSTEADRTVGHHWAFVGPVYVCVDRVPTPTASVMSALPGPLRGQPGVCRLPIPREVAASVPGLMPPDVLLDWLKDHVPGLMELLGRG